MPGLSDWWNNVVNGWHSFWDRLTGYYDQSQVGNFSQSEMMNPETTEAVSQLDPTNVNQQIPANDTNNGSNIDNALSGTPSISQYIQDNPDLSSEDYLRYMAEHSDEWAEKYIDYALEQQSINEQNEYVASREDTAYQRLVEDLKSAGLNPAMMYGSSGTVQGGSSAGVVKASEGASSRSISNYEKIKNLLLAYMMSNLKAMTGTANTIGNGLAMILKML